VVFLKSKKCDKLFFEMAGKKSNKVPATRKTTEYLIAFINNATPTGISMSMPVAELPIKMIQDGHKKRRESSSLCGITKEYGFSEKKSKKSKNKTTKTEIIIPEKKPQHAIFTWIFIIVCVIASVLKG